VNQELIALYWDIGKTIVMQQQEVADKAANEGFTD